MDLYFICNLGFDDDILKNIQAFCTPNAQCEPREHLTTPPQRHEPPNPSLPASRLHRGGRRVPGAIRRLADPGPPPSLPAPEALLAGDRGRVAAAAVRPGATVFRLGAVWSRPEERLRGPDLSAEDRVRQGVPRRKRLLEVSGAVGIGDCP